MPRSDPHIWDNVFATWDFQKMPFPSKLATEIGQVFKGILPTGASLLEAGSGSGELSAYLASIGYNVTLLDLSDVALSLSRELFKKHGLLGSFQKGDLFNLPFAEGSFDCVWNSGVLEHYTDQEIVAALKEMARVSKGLVITVVPNAGAIFYRLGKWNLERKGKLKTVKGMPFIDLSEYGVGKLVAGGKINKGIVVAVEKWTQKAEKVIKEAGGKIISPKEVEGVAS